MNEVYLKAPSLKPWKPDHSRKSLCMLMSGGVDSSVAAFLLKKAGWNVLGLTMLLPMSSSEEQEPVSICKTLDIPHYFLDVAEFFKNNVIRPFEKDYMEGKTPSPCVDCNKAIKFGIVKEYIKNHFGIDNIATGHYIRIIHEGDNTYLAKAVNHAKDQSYFLYCINKEHLNNLYFPLGDLSKDEVREIARKENFSSSNRPESMELCFAEEGDYRKSLSCSDKSSGSILDTEGNVIGQHNGIWNYTIGQRKGLGISAPEPLFVLSIIPEKNIIIAGSRSQAYCTNVSAYKINILQPKAYKPETVLHGKIRSTGNTQLCRIKTADEENLLVEFLEPVFAPASGQHLVLYDDFERIVAGGTIC